MKFKKILLPWHGLLCFCNLQVLGQTNLDLCPLCLAKHWWCLLTNTSNQLTCIPATGGYKQIGHDGTSWLKIRWKNKTWYEDMNQKCSLNIRHHEIHWWISYSKNISWLLIFYLTFIWHKLNNASKNLPLVQWNPTPQAHQGP